MAEQEYKVVLRGGYYHVEPYDGVTVHRFGYPGYGPVPNGPVPFCKSRRSKGRILRQAAYSKTSHIERQQIADWNKKWREQHSVQCHWCQHSFRPRNCHQDHVVPIAKGGEHILSNLVIACKWCNAKKGTKTIDRFTPDLSTARVRSKLAKAMKPPKSDKSMVILERHVFGLEQLGHTPAEVEDLMRGHGFTPRPFTSEDIDNWIFER